VKDTVVVFARAPRLGTVKRRLACSIGERAALRFYTASLARTLRMLAADPRFRTVVAVTPDGARGSWLCGLPCVKQGHGDLGQRMARVFRQRQHGRVAIVGSDIPGLHAGDLASAFAALGSAQACFGPAMDGGYWLVAMSPRRPADPFGRVRWSSRWALVDTLENFRHRRVAMLRCLRDVDTVADLLAVTESNRQLG
jgi:uncharacterized protein